MSPITLLVAPMSAFSELGLGSLSGLDWVVMLMFTFVGLAMLASLVLGLVLVVYSLLRVLTFAFALASSSKRRDEAANTFKTVRDRCRAAAASRSGSRAE